MPGREVSRWKYLQCSVQGHELRGRSAMVLIRFDNPWLLVQSASQTFGSSHGDQSVGHSSAYKSDSFDLLSWKAVRPEEQHVLQGPPASGKCSGLFWTCWADTQVSFGRRLMASSA